MDNTKKRIHIYLSNDIIEQLQIVASNNHSTVSGIVANLVDKEFNRSVDKLLEKKSESKNDQILNLLRKIERDLITVSHHSSAIYRNVNYSNRILSHGFQAKKDGYNRTIIEATEDTKSSARKKALRDYGTLITADLGVEDYLNESYDEESKIGIYDGYVVKNEISSQSNPSPDPVPPKRKGIDPNKYLKK